MNSNESDSKSTSSDSDEISVAFGGITELIVPVAPTLELAIRNESIIIAST